MTVGLEATMTAVEEAHAPTNMRLVVIASSVGTTFEWYDFFLFVPLATIISKVFFAGLNDSAAYIFALLSFAAGSPPVPLARSSSAGSAIGRSQGYVSDHDNADGRRYVRGRPAAELRPSGSRLADPLYPASNAPGRRPRRGMGRAAIYIAEHADPDKTRVHDQLDRNLRGVRAWRRACRGPRHPLNAGRGALRGMGLAASPLCSQRFCWGSRSGSG